MTHLRFDFALLSWFLARLAALNSHVFPFSKSGSNPCSPILKAPFACVKLAYVLLIFVELFPFSIVKPTD
jgi:hypothetical protein